MDRGQPRSGQVGSARDARDVLADDATQRTLDLAGRLVRLQAPLGQVTQYQYDALNDLVKIIDPLNGQTNLTYDGNGNLLRCLFTKVNGRKIMRNNLYVSVIIVTSLASSIVHAADQPRMVSVDVAKSLVLAALPSKTRHLPKFGLSGRQAKDFPQFYFFEALWAGAPNGSAVIGHYFVDSSTGDVWNAILECQEESTSELRKLQAKIRLRIGLSDSEYHRIKRKGPLCP